MNKNYIKPELVITEIDAANIVATSIGINGSKAAQQDYDGGGDAKAFDFDNEEEEW